MAQNCAKEFGKLNREAVKWLAAEQGNAEGTVSGFDVCYWRWSGSGWYRLAAEQGNAKAQYNLGWMYVNGEGVAENYRKAIKSFSRSNAGAQYNLGLMYAKGYGVVADNREAVKWYRTAAKQGLCKGTV